ncbi:MAG: hypothetical protein ACXACP_11765, partial [Candidatus Hodarchaeales archaeon]
IPPIVGYFIVLFLTSAFNLIATQLWTLPVIWPNMLYIGGILGGLIGGSIALYEISLYHKKERSITRGTLFSSDLYYIGTLMFLTYVLEFLSEHILMQIILFLLEVSLFAIIGWNLTKLLLETDPPQQKVQSHDITVSPSEETSVVPVESE